MAHVAQIRCRKVNNSEHSTSSALGGSSDNNNNEGKRRGGVGTQQTGMAVLGE